MMPYPFLDETNIVIEPDPILQSCPFVKDRIRSFFSEGSDLDPIFFTGSNPDRILLKDRLFLKDRSDSDSFFSEGSDPDLPIHLKPDPQL